MENVMTIQNEVQDLQNNEQSLSERGMLLDDMIRQNNLTFHKMGENLEESIQLIFYMSN